MRRSPMFLLCLALVAPGSAEAAFRLQIEPLPVPAPGIRQAPVTGYDRGPRFNVRPRAGVSRLIDPAPANGCEDQGGGFRIESGEEAGACIGGRPGR